MILYGQSMLHENFVPKLMCTLTRHSRNQSHLTTSYRPVLQINKYHDIKRLLNTYDCKIMTTWWCCWLWRWPYSPEHNKYRVQGFAQMYHHAIKNKGTTVITHTCNYTYVYMYLSPITETILLAIVKITQGKAEPGCDYCVYNLLFPNRIRMPTNRRARTYQLRIVDTVSPIAGSGQCEKIYM